MGIHHTLLVVPALAVCALIGSSTAGPGSSAQARGCHEYTFHDERAEGGVCCFTDHFHSGTSSGQSSRARATVEAIKSWEDFVYFEYGRGYDHWSLAHSKSMSCSNGNGWSCDAEARACHHG